MMVQLLDNTLRDGGNVVGHGFNVELTVSMVRGLLNSGIEDIELGNCKGLGAYELMGATKACTDKEYMDIIQPYLPHGRIGMFMLAANGSKAPVEMAACQGLNFLRVGANAGDGKDSLAVVKRIKRAGLICRYSLMKAYINTSEALAAEARMLEDAGVDKITIMDSAGTMFPQDVADYVTALKRSVKIPVGFHGHSNLGLSQANALAAVASGADEIDCSLLGMARSAGNCSTELVVAALKKEGYLAEVDFYKLLEYLETALIPAMKPHGYHVAVNPIDLMLGLAGCHSDYLPMFQGVAEEESVSLFKLIAEVSAIDQKNPNEALLRKVAHIL